jgi:hypothetical protein
MDPTADDTGTYASSFANPRQDVLARSGHAIGRQPKFADATTLGDVTGLTDPAALIGALRTLGGAPVALRVAEFTHETAPERTAFADCLADNNLSADLDGVEFWLLGGSKEATGQLFDAFGRNSHGARARFAVADLSDPASVDFTTGLLPKAACDAVIVDASSDELTLAAWDVLRRLLIPGGLALIRRTVAWLGPAGAGWSPLAAGANGAELWAAPPELSDDGPGETDGPGANLTHPAG